MDKLKLKEELSYKQNQLNRKNFAIEKIAKEINEIEDMHELESNELESKYNDLMEIIIKYQHEAGILKEEISLLHEEIAEIHG